MPATTLTYQQTTKVLGWLEAVTGVRWIAPQSGEYKDCYIIDPQHFYNGALGLPQECSAVMEKIDQLRAADVITANVRNGQFVPDSMHIDEDYAPIAIHALSRDKLATLQYLASFPPATTVHSWENPTKVYYPCSVTKYRN